LAYVFDPINNTLIDDEDKSLGNKLAVLDSDLEKVLQELNEKFGPGTIQQGTQGIPQPPIKTPQAIFEFEERMKGRMADGGRVKFNRGSNVIDSLSFEKIRKLFPTYFTPDYQGQITASKIKKILKIYSNKEGGRTYIGDKLGLNQVVVGRILNKAEENNLTTKVDPKEFKTKDIQRVRSDPTTRKIHNVIRPITDFDRKQNPDIPANAKYRIVFATPQGKTTKIPKEFIGVKYFENKKAANVALNKRLKADFSKPEDPTAAKFKAQKKRAEFLKRNAPLYVSGTGKYEFHHIMNIGGEIPLDTNDIAIISKKMNRNLSPYNKILNRIGDSITNLINEQPEGYLKRIDELNDAGEKVVKKAIKELPSEYKKLIGFNRVVPVLDEYGTPIDFTGKKFGGSNKKKPGVKLTELSVDQDAALKKQIKADAKALGKGRLKDKILSSTGKVLKGVGKVIKPVGYVVGTKALFDARAMAADQGIELSTVDQVMALDSGDPNVAIENYKRRTDPEYAAEQRAKDLAQMEDDFEEVGLDEIQPDETLKSFMANGGRVGFSNGGAAGADDNFLKELEFYFTNEDAELPKLQTYKETKNPIEILNDIIDPRNYPYYADVLARSGLRIGEFAVRVLPATGKLISDLIQKPAFKITGSNKNNYVQDYMDPLPPSNIKGTGIFSEFLENITPTSLEKKIGLDKLIKAEEQKQIDRGSTVGPKVFADTLGLGAEVTAPIFPGLKLVRAYAKKKNLPVNNVTKKLLIKEVDEVLEQRGMDRREFLQVTGAGATVVLAKMLGLGDDVAKTAKVAEKAAEKAAGGAPTYFFDLVDIIKKKGIDTTKQNALQDLQNVFSYKGYDLYEDLTTGEIRIEKTNTGIIRTADDVEEGIASQDVLEYKPSRTDADPETKRTITDPEEYNEGSVFPDSEGKMKEVEDLDIEEILEFIKNEKVN